MRLLLELHNFLIQFLHLTRQMGRKRVYYFVDKFKCLLTAILFVFIWFIHKTYFLLYLPETIQCLGQDIHLLFAD